MNFLIYYLVGKEHGLGHKYRCDALAEHLVDAGHSVYIINNDRAAHRHEIRASSIVDGQLCNTMFAIREMSSLYNVDTVIVDLKDNNEELNSYIKSLGLRLVLLNGVGHNVDSKLADLVWIQDSPHTVILRKKVLELSLEDDDRWLVFGGAADEMGLLRAFDAVCDEPADLLYTELAPVYSIDFIPNENHELIRVDGDEILKYMAKARKACVHMGMIAWELVCGYTNVYIVSKNDGHRKFADNLERLGLAKSYHGDINDERFIEFLSATQFNDRGNYEFDGHINIVRELEK